MEQFSLRGVWELIVRSRIKILLIGALFMIAVAPAIYLLAPAKYSIQTNVSIPYDGVTVESYEILIRRSIIKQVCRKLRIDSSAAAVAEIDRHLSIAIDEHNKKLYIGYLGGDPVLVTDIGTEISMQTLKNARDERIDNLKDEIKVRQERLKAIDELMNDEFIAGYYDKLYERWKNLVREAEGTALNVFLDVDPTIKNAYLEKKDLGYEIRHLEKLINILLEEDDENLEEYFTPIYQPEQKEPPRLLLVVLASAVLGLLFGLLWVVVSNYGIKKIKKEGI